MYNIVFQYVFSKKIIKKLICNTQRKLKKLCKYILDIKNRKKTSKCSITSGYNIVCYRVHSTLTLNSCECNSLKKLEYKLEMTFLIKVFEKRNVLHTVNEFIFSLFYNVSSGSSKTSVVAHPTTWRQPTSTWGVFRGLFQFGANLTWKLFFSWVFEGDSSKVYFILNVSSWVVKHNLLNKLKHRTNFPATWSQKMWVT